jgi:hypothetical protein
MSTPICNHGNLARVCELCERDRRIVELETIRDGLAELLRLLSDEGVLNHVTASVEHSIAIARARREVCAASEAIERLDHEANWTDTQDRLDLSAWRSALATLREMEKR